MSSRYANLTEAQRLGLANNSKAKSLFSDRMDELGCDPVHSFTVFVNGDGFHIFCSETWSFSSWSASNLSGEEVVGLFASSFIGNARDENPSDPNFANRPK